MVFGRQSDQRGFGGYVIRGVFLHVVGKREEQEQVIMLCVSFLPFLTLCEDENGALEAVCL